MRPWQTEELENLITYMEENHERLCGKPVDWISRAKGGIFPDSEGFKHIARGKVRDKYTNMKTCKDAKTMQLSYV